MNISVALGTRLKGKGCRPFNSDTKVRIQQGNDLRFYYPDVQIVCRFNRMDEHFQDHPTVIFEVRSESTMRIDSGEKRDAYLRLPSLEAYVLVHDEQQAVTVWRRQGDQWESEYYTEQGDVIAFPGAECELTLAEIYEGSGV